MTEPTIDEMLKWLFVVDKYLAGTGSDIASSREVEAIRAILEHHEKLCATAERIKLEAIRAFVERVEKGVRLGWHKFECAKCAEQHLTWFDEINRELAAMEKESNAGTND